MDSQESCSHYNPDTYYNSEALNTSTGDYLVIDYKATATSGASPFTFGPGATINWT